MEFHRYIITKIINKNKNNRWWVLTILWGFNCILKIFVVNKMINC